MWQEASSSLEITTFPDRDGGESDTPSRQTGVATFFFHVRPQMANFSEAGFLQIILEGFVTRLDLSYPHYIQGRGEEEEACVRV